MSQFSIIGTPLYQWELGRRLKIVPLRGMRIDSVHFSNYGDSEALVVKPKEENGQIIAEIPNILLQDDQNIVVHSVNVSEEKVETIQECVFPVRKRAKPSSYVYTETEVMTYKALDERIKALEQGGGGSGDPGKDGGYYIPSVSQVDKNTMNVSFKASKEGMPAVEDQTITLPSGNAEQIAQAVEDYMAEHPVTPAFAASTYDVKKIGQLIAQGGIDRIILLGDSITDGYGGTGYNGSKTSKKSTNTDGYCWANLFKKYVSERYGVSVENYGFYGTVSKVQYDNVKDVVGANDLVIWLTGTNNRISSEAFADLETNIKTYVNDLKSKANAVVFMPCIPATSGDDATRFKTAQDINDAALKNVYGETYYIDMYTKYIEWCNKNGKIMKDTMYDALHPNDAGQRYIFEILCQELGLPMSAFTDFTYNGDFWGGVGFSSADVLIDTGLSKTGIAFSSWNSSIVPVAMMSRYSDYTNTTLFSGKTLRRIVVGGKGFKAGTLTIGTVALDTLGSSLNMENTVEVTVNADGIIDFTKPFIIPEHHTLAIGAVTDTARLSYYQNVTSETYMYTADNWKAKPNPTIALVAAFYV